MAPKIKAVNAYRPRIEQGTTVQKPEFVRFISRATTLLEGSVGNVLTETRDQIINFCRMGRAVKLDGLGTFTPTVDLDGNFSISFRPDSAMNAGINMPGVFSGRIINREHIGKTSDELVALWNAEHGDDPVTVTE
jgi:hypothetical protein